MPRAPLSYASRKAKDKRMRLTPYVVTTPVTNLIKNRKLYRNVFIDWCIKYKDLLGLSLPTIDDKADEKTKTEVRTEIESIVKRITFIHFCYKNHGRNKGCIYNKSHIYECIAELIHDLDKGAGLLYKKNVLYRYLSDPKHSNINVDFITLGAQVRAVYRHKYKCEEID